MPVWALRTGSLWLRPSLRGAARPVTGCPSRGLLRAGGPRRQRQVHAVSLLLRFYQAQSGRVTLDGVELSRFGDAHFRADVGLMPQDPFLLASSVRDNISVGRALGQAEIETAARATHCHDSIVQLEQGIYQRLCLLQQLGESSVFGSDG